MNTMRTQAVAKRQTTAKRTLAIFEHIITGLKSKWEKAEKETTTKWLKSQRAEAVLGLTSFEPKSSCFFFTGVKLGKDQERNSGTSDQSKRILIASNRILKKIKQFFSIASFSPLAYVETLRERRLISSSWVSLDSEGTGLMLLCLCRSAQCSGHPVSLRSSFSGETPEVTLLLLHSPIN